MPLSCIQLLLLKFFRCNVIQLPLCIYKSTVYGLWLTTPSKLQLPRPVNLRHCIPGSLLIVHTWLTLYLRSGRMASCTSRVDLHDLPTSLRHA
eukprot:5309157-Pyramimonas_sp.AAC.1